MATWNSAYESTPGSTYNPGGGAASIRSLKVGIRERLNRAHFLGDDEGLTAGELGGQHREGSARVFVLDSDTTNRDDMATPAYSSALVGLMRVNMEELEDPNRREVDGVEMDDADQLTKTLEVIITDPDDNTNTTSVTLFSYDDLVNIISDQIIEGLKTFTLAPLVTEVVELEDEIDEDNEGKLVRYDEIQAYAKEGKYHNALDPTDADNREFWGGTGGADDPLPTSIHVDTITATNIYGVAWA